MCFSAEVSFGASAVLTATGAITLKKNRKKELMPLAMVPLLFGIQQFFEGWVWISLQNETYASFAAIATYGFLIFAQLVWPVWVPFSVYVPEKEKIRKKLITFSLTLGIILALLLGYRMIFYDVNAYIQEHHIFYKVGHFKSTNWWSGIFYLLPALFPFIFSSIKKVNILGWLMLLMFVISKVFYLRYMISTWCFFAAVLSVYIYFIIKDLNRQQ
ncbi:MAG: hypothetical protein GXO47_02805 [Chlorobi bacterium]|nr:hypothetical protein [Chlorobiota bacterium]